LVICLQKGKIYEQSGFDIGIGKNKGGLHEGWEENYESNYKKTRELCTQREE